MLVRIGQLSFYNGKRDVFIKIGKKKERLVKAGVVITSKDIDIRWLDEICKLIEKDAAGNYNVSNNCVRKYLLLYLIFSTRQRIFLEDIIDIGEEHELYRKKNKGFDFQNYYWNELSSFMTENGYKYKMLKSNIDLYQGEIRVPQERYNWNERWSLAGIKLFVTRLESYFIGRTGYCTSCIGREISRTKVRRSITKDFREVNDLLFRSQSGCLFFRGISIEGRKKFIKCAGVFGADILDEYIATRWLKEKTGREMYYVLPKYPESQEKKLIYDYEEQQITLNEVLQMRNLQIEEFEMLLDFFIAVLEELKEYHVIHRDIRPDNILVQFDNKGRITMYKLIDFGCACINEKIRNKNWRDRRKNKYAGSFFRYSLNGWNDAASALFLISQIPNVDYKLYRTKLRRIEAIMGENYTISIPY